jgi:DNA-binding HxlR family transcriptional regulator
MDRQAPAMSSSSPRDSNCGIAHALDAFGDQWSLLIIRDAFFGLRRFSDFQRNLGIARNILSDRLQRLVEHGILQRVDAGASGTRFEYRLSEKGEDLLPVLTALREWSDRWVAGEGQEALIITERASGERVPRLRILSAAGRELKSADLQSRPGPGADAAMLRLFEFAARAGSQRE